MTTEILIAECRKHYDFPKRPAFIKPKRKRVKGKAKKEYFYELGRFHGNEVVYLVYPEYMYRKVPYRCDKKKHKDWIYVEELNVYRCNTSLT